MVHDAIDGGERHGGVGEDLAPFAERLVGGDQQRSALVARADQFEQDARLRLVLSDIGEIVEDQQVIFVELDDRGFEDEITAARAESFCTRSVVRANSTRQPFSTKARPSAAA